MNYHDDFGSIITNARRMKNISQNTLAKKLFVTRQAVSNWENNKTRPDISVLFKLCKILDIDIKKVVELDGNITVEDIIEVEKRKTTKRNLIFSSIIIIVLIFIIFTLIVVFNRNEFALYNVYLDSDEFSLNNSIIVKSKVQNYFQLGTLVSNLDITDNNTEYNIKLYKKYDNEERLIFKGKYEDNFYLTEKYGYGEYFDDNDITLDKIYIEISFVVDDIEYVYDYKLRVEQKFSSGEVLYLKNNGCSDKLANTFEFNIEEENILNNGYVYDKDNNSYIKEDDYYIMFFPESMLITLKEELDDKILLIDYFVSQDRFRVTNYDSEMKSAVTDSFLEENILDIYKTEINYLKEEINIFRGN